MPTGQLVGADAFGQLARRWRSPYEGWNRVLVNNVLTARSQTELGARTGAYMIDFSVSESLRLVLRTFPFVLLRAAVYFGIAAAFVVMTGTGAGIGYGLGSLAGSSGRAAGAFWGAIGGFAIVLLVLWWLREYLLYLVKAGHIAAMVLFYDGKSPPPGQGQIGHAIGVVQQRFVEISVLFVVDRLVLGVIRTLVGLANFANLILPGSGGTIAKIVDTILRVAVGFVDEIILAYSIRTRSTDPFASARDALILYAQNHWTMIRNALLLSAIVYALAFLVFLLALAPAAAFAYASPGGASIVAVLLAGVFAWSVKQAFLEPFVIASLMQVYFRTIDGQKPEQAWDGRLTELSNHFRELKSRIGTASRTTG